MSDPLRTHAPLTAVPATRAEGLARLAAFAPHAGRAYAEGRNSDPGPDRRGAVSRLSPWLRYRLIAESEVVGAVLARHRLPAAEKFVQEVLWRTYWKGWLELRPDIWTRYLTTLRAQREALADPVLLAQAEAGETGIAGFDDWARELVASGYLHNHARMWFASIWIFTLRLPWALGADFFARHLIDADPASNTLSWRWVAGLQTAGKTYLATTENIARYTGGRFAPSGLATEAVALREPPPGPPRPLPGPVPIDPTAPALLLVTPEDLHPEALFPPEALVRGVQVVQDPGLLGGDHARRFVAQAAQDAVTRLASRTGWAVGRGDRLDAASLIAAAQAIGVRQVVTPHAPVGPVADRLAKLAPQLAAEGITLGTRRRPWDSRFWPLATKGFFPFRERIPQALAELALDEDAAAGADCGRTQPAR